MIRAECLDNGGIWHYFARSENVCAIWKRQSHISVKSWRTQDSISRIVAIVILLARILKPNINSMADEIHPQPYEASETGWAWQRIVFENTCMANSAHQLIKYWFFFLSVLMHTKHHPPLNASAHFNFYCLEIGIFQCSMFLFFTYTLYTHRSTVIPVVHRIYMSFCIWIPFRIDSIHIQNISYVILTFIDSLRNTWVLMCAVPELRFSFNKKTLEVDVEVREWIERDAENYDWVEMS